MNKQPSHSQPPYSKERVEYEEEYGLCNSGLGVDVVRILSDIIIRDCESSH